ncbi:hypothetical protein P5G51_004970 [Virgibacillus sp. 179-BFC.A HS]|uniref:GNAT family N-acetyltransferase n=1 Tax=Tigheibacillus jepli TaxID=3035914 RepID=A0ABU5CET0_9BACI|nr:hypothetical protein [Virgibacillus sp. 179-BFC.A HS]MDY0404838.1 hypothetical protein [Virgibacillus sp. 179-BFC.A HS]
MLSRGSLFWHYDKSTSVRFQLTVFPLSHCEGSSLYVAKRALAPLFIFVHTFAREKGIAVCREAKIESLRKNNQLVISCVYHRDGRKLASHLMIADGEKAFGLYSASIRLVKSEFTKAEIGRANRYLHWKDILFFKQKGYRTHDFLGLSSDGDNKPYQNINQFKKGFGGREEISYNSYVPQTKKGVLLILFLRWKWRHQLELIKKSCRQGNAKLSLWRNQVQVLQKNCIKCSVEKRKFPCNW